MRTLLAFSELHFPKGLVVVLASFGAWLVLFVAYWILAAIVVQAQGQLTGSHFTAGGF